MMDFMELQLEAMHGLPVQNSPEDAGGEQGMDFLALQTVDATWNTTQGLDFLALQAPGASDEAMHPTTDVACGKDREQIGVRARAALLFMRSARVWMDCRRCVLFQALRGAGPAP